MLPFTLEQFLNVFATYNKAIWPAQILAYVLGAVAVAALFRKGRASDRIVSAILGLMWLSTGILYHGVFFSSINKAAFAFGALFVAEGAALLYTGIVRDGLRFAINDGFRAAIGAGFILYASLVYPLIGIATGHPWPTLPMFGVSPCPVTIFTFGLLLMTTGRFSYWLLVIPFIWSVIGGSAAILLDVRQDWLLLVSGFIAVPILVVGNRHARAAADEARLTLRSNCAHDRDGQQRPLRTGNLACLQAIGSGRQSLQGCAEASRIRC
ncbi:DUF6064 family protein [Bradyrhizobium symbiodeficiens]|uniref:DUF6064 family protein n=1 Tax=Bradyrhizobium symbiodeficiens TaxID=1404367 RepID=UPI0030CF20E5